ncbi:formyltetrahydrofolate deformylase [Mycobacterium sp. KBS0706]|uniref:formyltetrahydrofolate deformylase n=1 Tax=Mycobacterium sp. KBS0706 TaxID=2578109 RepID=UPI00110FDE3D|nr:formyltetrahydrofolate deformylase [Mycobacterium sp. KBS0706]TSD90344.1 formyltetrahydrofolate deformylase [Mycobacterium sp. KBS0706]
MAKRLILKLSCTDVPGIVARISDFVFRSGLNILESAQFFDRDTGRFFMRVVVEAVEGTADIDALREGFTPIGSDYGMDWELHDADRKIRALIMVSKFDHCLNDILYRVQIGSLPIEIPAVVSNHRDSYQRVAAAGIPFHHLPVTRDNKAQQERRLLDLVDEEKIDLVVLARYMQVLSSDLCRKMEGRVINIHHSFLPSFKGAKPYHQAHSRGVKLIGATSHYVTDDLDEGPIIDQDVTRVDHTASADDWVAIGRDVESVVLARALKYHSEHRVLLNGAKTVVFR